MNSIYIYDDCAVAYTCSIVTEFMDANVLHVTSDGTLLNIRMTAGRELRSPDTALALSRSCLPTVLCVPFSFLDLRAIDIAMAPKCVQKENDKTKPKQNSYGGANRFSQRDLSQSCSS